MSDNGVFEESSMLLHGKVVLLTGGASGLGRVLLGMLVREGAMVAFTYRRSKEQAEKLKDLYGSSVLAMYADASDYEKAKTVVKKTIETFGKLDVVINNAASAKHAAFLKLSLDDVDYSMRNSFYPAFNYANAAAPFFVEQGSGTIISIGSINGERGREGSMPYCAAKAAVEGLSKTIAKELGRYGVRCNVISPGYIDTEGQENTSPLIHKMVLDECAIKHLTTPEEVGNLVLFLSSDKAKTITGQVYRIDCGQYI